MEIDVTAFCEPLPTLIPVPVVLWDLAVPRLGAFLAQSGDPTASSICRTVVVVADGATINATEMYLYTSLMAMQDHAPDVAPALDLFPFFLDADAILAGFGAITCDFASVWGRVAPGSWVAAYAGCPQCVSELWSLNFTSLGEPSLYDATYQLPLGGQYGRIDFACNFTVIEASSILFVRNAGPLLQPSRYNADQANDVVSFREVDFALTGKKKNMLQRKRTAPKQHHSSRQHERQTTTEEEAYLLIETVPAAYNQSARVLVWQQLTTQYLPITGIIPLDGRSRLPLFGSLDAHTERIPALSDWRYTNGGHSPPCCVPALSDSLLCLLTFYTPYCVPALSDCAIHQRCPSSVDVIRPLLCLTALFPVPRPTSTSVPPSAGTAASHRQTSSCAGSTGATSRRPSLAKTLYRVCIRA